MGVVRCDKHGTQGAAEVAPKLKAELLADAPIDAAEIVRFRLYLFGAKEPLCSWVDPETLSAHGLQAEHYAETEEEFERLEPFYGSLEGACSKCFRLWLSKHGLDPDTY